MDFTHCGELGVTVGGEPFGHLLFHFVLSHSGWRYVDLAYGETFAALVKGMQGALWELGGVPEVFRTDNLSAATHELKGSGGRALNERYAAVLAHYGLRSTRTNPRSSHENGVAEQGHHRLKGALGQALVLRGSRDIGSVEAYLSFVRQVADKRNRLVWAKLEHERRHLRPLPPAPVPEYVVYRTSDSDGAPLNVVMAHSIRSRQCRNVLCYGRSGRLRLCPRGGHATCHSARC